MVCRALYLQTYNSGVIETQDRMSVCLTAVLKREKLALCEKAAQRHAQHSFSSPLLCLAGSGWQPANCIIGYFRFMGTTRHPLGALYQKSCKMETDHTLFQTLLTRGFISTLELGLRDILTHYSCHALYA